MISRSLEAEVLRLHHAERWPIGTIARQLLLHHSTVRRVLAQAGAPAAQKTTRPSLADPQPRQVRNRVNAGSGA